MLKPLRIIAFGARQFNSPDGYNVWVTPEEDALDLFENTATNTSFISADLTNRVPNKATKYTAEPVSAEARNEGQLVPANFSTTT
jgi:hypothetical protein